jgi:hypothetical protein
VNLLGSVVVRRNAQVWRGRQGRPAPQTNWNALRGGMFPRASPVRPPKAQRPGRFKATSSRDPGASKETVAARHGDRFFTAGKEKQVLDFSGTPPRIRAFIQLAAKEITMMQTSITLCRSRLA